MAVARFRPGGAPDPAYGGGDGVAEIAFPVDDLLGRASRSLALPGGEAYVAGTADRGPGGASSPSRS